MQSAIRSAALALLACPAPAQEPGFARFQPVTAPVRSAGVLHLATGTWTRKVSAAAIGADVVYDNTCAPSYLFPFSGDSYVREGRLPSPTGPTNAYARPGCSVGYQIDGFQIAYCTDQPSPGTLTIGFRESQPLCASMQGVPLQASFALSGLPGSSGAQACWTVVIDLDSPPQTASLSFHMRADGDGSYSGLPADNLFGMSFDCSLPAAQSTGTGLLWAGSPWYSPCSGYDGTRWDPVLNYAESGTGLEINSGSLYVEPGGASTPGCYVFAAPIQSVWIELYADACPGDFSNVFCPGDGTGTACPCGNSSPAGEMAGCLSSLGIGARVRGVGMTSLSLDTFVLNGDRMPASSPALYFQGTVQQAAGAGAMFGDGKRCAGGTVARLAIEINSAAGASSHPGPGDPPVHVQGQITTPGTRTYQVWYRNIASFCTPAGFNLTNGVEAIWAP